MIGYTLARTRIIEGWFINVKPGCHDKNEEGWILWRERQLLSTTVLVILVWESECQPSVLETLFGMLGYCAIRDGNYQLGTSPQIISLAYFFSSRFCFSFPLSGLQYSELTKSFDSEVKFLWFESWLQYVNSEIWGKLFTFFLDPSSNPFLPVFLLSSSLHQLL